MSAPASDATSAPAGASTSAPAGAVHAALQELDRNPPDAKERQVACRSLVRYNKVGGHNAGEPIAATEDWVRLYIALRRTKGEGARISMEQLRDWKLAVSTTTTVKRKCLVVERSKLDALPEYPEGLDAWVIPQGSLDLPADIYGEDVIIIDDGYDRRKLNVPVLHLELAVKWERKVSSTAAPSGLQVKEGTTLQRPPRKNVQPGPLLAATSAAPAASASASSRESNVAPAAAPEALNLTDSVAQSDMTTIVQSTVRAVSLAQWVCGDKSQPMTVEFWLRHFVGYMKRQPKGAAWTDGQLMYIKYITKALYESDDHHALMSVAKHLQACEDLCGDALPCLTKGIIRLSQVDLGWKSESERAFHDWVTVHLSLPQLQILYNSASYQSFLTCRFRCRLEELRSRSSGAIGRSSGCSDAIGRSSGSGDAAGRSSGPGDAEFEEQLKVRGGRARGEIGEASEKMWRPLAQVLLQSPTANALEKASLRFALGLLTAGGFTERVGRLWDDPAAKEELPLWKAFNDTLGAYVAFGNDCQFQDWKHMQSGEVVQLWDKLADAGVKDRCFVGFRGEGGEGAGGWQFGKSLTAAPAAHCGNTLLTT